MTDLETLKHCDLCGSGAITTLFPNEHIMRCPDCDYVFHSPRPTEAAIFRYYDQLGKYDHWLEELEGREKMWGARLAMIRRFVREGLLLDVGAGIGQFLDLARGPFQIQGTEVSGEAIKEAKERFGIDLIPGVVEDADLVPETVDALTMIHVLEHVPSPRETIAACRALLKPGGYLFVAVPNDSAAMRFKAAQGGLRALMAALTGSLGEHDWSHGPPSGRLDLEDYGLEQEIHLSHFNEDTLGRFLRAQGFEDVRFDLDPAYPTSGRARLRDDLKYLFWSAVRRLTGRNLYGTLFVSARRRDI